MPEIVYCSCSSTKRGELIRLPCDKMNPDSRKRIFPSFVCPDCLNHRSLYENLTNVTTSNNN